MHPIVGLWFPLSVLYWRISCFSSLKVAQPLRFSKTSYAIFSCKEVWLKKKPMPPIALNGLLSLNRKGSPCCKILNVELPPGCQKLISSGKFGLNNCTRNYQLLQDKISLHKFCKNNYTKFKSFMEGVSLVNAQP